MKTCTDCGMPMLAPEDFAGGNPESNLCLNCGPARSSAGEVINYAVFTAVLGKADDVYAFLEQNLHQTRRFDGLREAFISQDRENPGRFFVMSKWKSQEAYDAMQQAYAANPRIQQSYADIRHMLTCDPEMGSYIVMK